MNTEQVDSMLGQDAEFWARVEVVGRRTYHGKVRVEFLGGSAFFRVDVPALPERVERRRCWALADDAPAGSSQQVGLYDLTMPTRPAHQYLIGAGSIYMLTPMPESTVLQILAREAEVDQPLKMARVAEPAGELPPATEDEPLCAECGHRKHEMELPDSSCCPCWCHAIQAPPSHDPEFAI
jgi:hypothetical protein